MAEASEPLVYWIISCFDKRQEDPLPVYNRVFGEVVPAYHVIKQNFDHWVANCSLAAPDRKAIDDLFENYVAKAKES